MWQPRTLIVRLYPGSTGPTSGLVEDALSGQQCRFTGKDELWTLLSETFASDASDAEPVRPGKGRKPAARRE